MNFTCHQYSTTKRFRLGNPFPTGAVFLEEHQWRTETPQSPKGFEVSFLDDGQVCFTKSMAEDVEIYGLGQTMGNLNKRGARYRMYAIDDFQHTPEKESLYGSHPFLIWKSSTEEFGVFLDFPGEIVFDVGFTDRSTLVITVPKADFDFYFLPGQSMKEITKNFMTLVGTPFLPPRWSFGYHQSRWGYVNEKDVLDVVEGFEKNEIPLDGLYLDLDYMDNFKVFSLSSERFPHFRDMVSQLKSKGVHVAPIIDPGVKIETGYRVYEEGKAKGYFITDKEGKPFQAAVWPGLTHFPDFLNPKARSWWGSQYKMLHDMGIDGFWNDMNEPAVFYSPTGLKKAVKTIVETATEGANLGIKFLELVDDIKKRQNDRDDMRAMYHDTPSHGKVSQDSVHNLFGMKMAEAVKEGYEQFAPDTRYHLLSRSTYIGQHRFSGMWTGDNASWWEHLKLNIQHLCSLGMCGFYYAGADIGGFSSDSSGEMLTRWNQLAVFSPLFRNHSNLFCRRQEPWSFDDSTLEASRQSIRLRYALLPYLYSTYVTSIETSLPPVRMLGFDFESDERSRATEDQFLCGNTLIVAPVIQNQSRARMVYLPKGNYLHWNVASFSDRSEMKLVTGGDHYVEASLHECPLYLRENSLLPIGDGKKNSFNMAKSQQQTLTIVGLVSDQAEFVLHWDDGLSKSRKNRVEIAIRVRKHAESFEASFDRLQGEWSQIPWSRIQFEIYDHSGVPTKWLQDLR